MFKYQAIIEELTKENILPANDIFDYQFAPLKAIYKNYFEYCQEYLSKYCHAYEIEPARFYFRNENSVNAVAYRKNGFFLIGVNTGTIRKTYNLFYDQNKIFEEDGQLAKEFTELSEIINIPLGFLMFQLSTLFTFHHELAHLVQKSSLLIIGVKEKYNSLVNKNSIIERHVLEFDSDLHGADAVSSQILLIFKKLATQYQNPKNLVKLLSIGIATIYIYFILCFPNKLHKIYYMQFSHPHPLIRISYVLDRFIRTANEDLPISAAMNPEKLAQLGFVISNIFLKTQKNHNSVIDEFPNQFLENFDSIENYINDLLEYSRKEKNLMMNRA
jgi:hypothetical protein